MDGDYGACEIGTSDGFVSTGSRGGWAAFTGVLAGWLAMAVIVEGVELQRRRRLRRVGVTVRATAVEKRQADGEEGGEEESEPLRVVVFALPGLDPGAAGVSPGGEAKVRMLMLLLVLVLLLLLLLVLLLLLLLMLMLTLSPLAPALLPQIVRILNPDMLSETGTPLAARFYDQLRVRSAPSPAAAPSPASGSAAAAGTSISTGTGSSAGTGSSGMQFAVTVDPRNPYNCLFAPLATRRSARGGDQEVLARRFT